MPNESIDSDVLLGDDFISKFRMVYDKHGYTFLRDEKNNGFIHDYAAFYNITVEPVYVVPPQYRNPVKQLIQKVMKRCQIQQKNDRLS